MSDEILTADHLRKEFAVARRAGSGPRTEKTFAAVDDVSLALAQGETLAVVGESGSGKTTVARLLLGVERPTSGAVSFRGRDIASMPKKALRQARRDLQMIFQDPYASLDPRLTVKATVETALLPLKLGASARAEMVQEALNAAGLNPVDDYLTRRPAELSGGQRQRVAIARAVATRPAVIVADEPVSMLDVSVQAGVLNTLRDIQGRLHTAYLLITHDLGVARYLSHRIVVMYAGRTVEAGPTESIIGSPQHPYTASLIAAAGHESDAAPPAGRSAAVASRDPHSCAYATRCPLATDLCRTVRPTLAASAADSEVACHFPLGAASQKRPTAQWHSPAPNSPVLPQAEEIS
jgi:oligopeptide/dipeptide ABC transporter ATP-binding protein